MFLGWQISSTVTTSKIRYSTTYNTFLFNIRYIMFIYIYIFTFWDSSKPPTARWQFAWQANRPWTSFFPWNWEAVSGFCVCVCVKYRSLCKRHWFQIPSLLENTCLIRIFCFYCHYVFPVKLYFFLHFGFRNTSNFCKQIPWVELFFSSKFQSQQAEVTR